MTKRQPKTFVIANPFSGKKRLQKIWEKELYPTIQNAIGHFDFALTEYPRHATKLTQQALKNGYDTIVCLGGDGTLNEVVNGFFENEKPIRPKSSLGILPFGSGGDFLRTLNFPRKYKPALEHLKSKQTRSVDVGMIKIKGKKPRYFINIANVGLVATIMNYVNQKGKRWPTNAKYISGSLQGFVAHKNLEAKIAVDDHPIKTCSLTDVIIANGQYFGGGMRPAPGAILDDSLFDVYILKNLNLAKLLFYFPQMYFASKFTSKNILEHHKCSKIRIVCKEKKNCQIEADGEICGSGSVEFQIIPKALKIRV